VLALHARAALPARQRRAAARSSPRRAAARGQRDAGGAFRLLQAKRDEIASGERYVATLTDYWVARASLDALLSGAPGRAPSSLFVASTPPSSAPPPPTPTDMDPLSRRNLLSSASLVGAARSSRARPAARTVSPEAVLPPGMPGVDYRPVVTPDGAALRVEARRRRQGLPPRRRAGDARVRAGPRRECWGYNGRVHGPTIEAVEGDRVRIYVTNKLGPRRRRCTGTACSCRTAWTASAG
jgi:hypothetical protein